MSEKDKEIMIVYANDVAYIGQVDPDDLNHTELGIKIERPFVVNIRPVHKEERLEAVMIDVILPIEFGGVPVVEGVYSGFMYVTTGSIDLPNGKTTYINGPSGDKLAVNKVAAIANRDDPSLKIFNITKIIKPSAELVMIYNSKTPTYNEVLFAPRLIDMRPIQQDEADQPPDMPPTPPATMMVPPEPASPISCNGDGKSKGNVIDLSSKRKN